MTRLKFASLYATRHALLSLAIGVACAAIVFLAWYPMPYREILGVGSIFMLILIVDVVCGPLMTLILASPRKSKRETIFDFTLIGTIQLAALLYGLHSVWVARPAVLAFERDRLVVLGANEIETEQLNKAPQGLRSLPFSGVLKVGTRKAASNKEFFESVETGLAGISPGMRPAWWVPMDMQADEMRARAKPLQELIARLPERAAVLKAAASATSLGLDELLYLPLTSSRNREWVAILNPSNLEMVSYAPVDGF